MAAKSEKEPARKNPTAECSSGEDVENWEQVPKEAGAATGDKEDKAVEEERHSNRVKMITIYIQILQGMVKSGCISGRKILILRKFPASVEERAAMLNVGCGGVSDSVAIRESCLAAIYGLSDGGLRFKGLAKEIGVEEVLGKVEEIISDRAKEKVRRMLEVMNEKDEEID